MLRLGAIALLACASGCVSTYQKDWVEVRSAHFSVKSALDRSKAEQLAKDLERLRQVVAKMTNAGEAEDPPIPTRMFLFDRSSYVEWRPGRDNPGFFMAGMRANWIVMTEGRGAEAQDIIQHEYAHYILHNRGGATYPRWYDEGFAQVFSTVRERDGKVYVGEPSPMLLAMTHARTWIPIANLISSDRTQKANETQFYGEAWALVHYLYFGREQRASGELARYLAALEQRVDPAAAFARAFGLTTDQADERVQSYLRSGMNATVWPASQFADAGSTGASPLAADEIAADLGELAVRCASKVKPELLERADAYFRAALAQNPRLARAYTGLGNVASARGKLDQAERYYRQADTYLGDASSQLDFGWYYVARADAARARDEQQRWLGEARKRFVRAWKIDPEIPESYAGYGLTYAFDGEDAGKGLETLEHAAELIPSNLDIRVALAKLYLELHRNADARALLTRVVVWMHPDDPETKNVLALLARAEAAPGRGSSARVQDATGGSYH